MATAAAAFRVGVHNLDAGIVRRSVGHSVTAAAAYNARCRIKDERTGQLHDYTGHSNRPLGEYFYAPAGAPEWAQGRAAYWNAVERRENRQDSQLARSFIITIPHEMEYDHVRQALHDFVRETFARRGYGADLVVHPAHSHGDDRNIHAHLLVALRKVEKDGSWSKKKDPAEPDTDQLRDWKERCANQLNKRLEHYGYDFRVDYRGLQERGEDREPQIKLGKDAAAQERKGIKTDRGDENRAIDERNRARKATREAEKRAAREAEAEAERKTARARVAAIVDEAKLAAPESAIERQQREDRERAEETKRREDHERTRSVGIPGHIREIVGALWQLGRTMGQALSRIVLGSDRDSLVRQIRFERQEAQRQAREADRLRTLGPQIRTENSRQDPDPDIKRNMPGSFTAESISGAPQRPGGKPVPETASERRQPGTTPANEPPGTLAEQTRRKHAEQKPADVLRDILRRPGDDDDRTRTYKGPKR